MMRWLLLLVLGGCQVRTEVGGPRIDERDLTDDDGDGYSERQGDCDDGDARVAPGLEEVCDGVDTDCDGRGDYPALCDRNEVFTQRADLDVLFVIDSAEGMVPLQQELVGGLELFTDRMLSEDLVPRVAVAAADRKGIMESPFGYPWASPDMTPEAVVDWLSEAVLMGDMGQLPRVREAISGTIGTAFHRDRAFLQIVILSRGDDTTEVPLLDELMESFDNWKGTGRVRVHAIVPGEACEEGVAEANLNLVLRTSGTLVDVCDPDDDIASSLSTVVQAAAGDALAMTFFIAEAAIPESVAIQVTPPGGVRRPWAGDFDVESDPPRVELRSAPVRGSTIEIKYEIDPGR
jgi:hypothetical protein